VVVSTVNPSDIICTVAVKVGDDFRILSSRKDAGQGLKASAGGAPNSGGTLHVNDVSSPVTIEVTHFELRNTQ
jgi:hypothetical protein